MSNREDQRIQCDGGTEYLSKPYVPSHSTAFQRDSAEGVSGSQPVTAGQVLPGRSKVWLSIGCLVPTLCLTILVGFELLARASSPLWGMTDVCPCRTLRPGLGGGFRANCVGPWIRKLRDGRTVFDITLRTDASGHRITPQPASNRAHPLALFLGCSFTLGAGVHSYQTLPAQFAKLSRYRVENWGASGFGPQHALAQLSGDVPEDTSLAVYTLIPGHIGRAAGAWQVVGTFGRYFPAPEGGTFEESRPWSTWLASWAVESALLRRLPEARDASGVALVTSLLTRARARFNGRFIVLAWPGAWQDRRLLDSLMLAGLEVREPRGDGGETLLDGHPAASAYAQVAEWLSKEMER